MSNDALNQLKPKGTRKVVDELKNNQKDPTVQSRSQETARQTKVQPEKENKKSKGKVKESKQPNDSKQEKETNRIYEGTVFGEGNSKRSDQSKKGWKTSNGKNWGKTIYTDDFVDKTTSYGRESSQRSLPLLLEAPKTTRDVYSNTGRDVVQYLLPSGDTGNKRIIWQN